MDIEEYNKINDVCVKKITGLIEDLPQNIIVITHHLPIYNLINDYYKQYKYRLLNQWFYCDLDVLIEKNKNKIKCWVYGHTHIPCEKNEYNIDFICNPIGYKNENKKIEYNKVYCKEK